MRHWHPQAGLGLLRPYISMTTRIRRLNHRVSVAGAHEPREFFHGLASEYLLNSINAVRPQDLSLTGSDLVAPEQIATSEPAIESDCPVIEKDWTGTNKRQAQARKELFESLGRSEAREKLHLATCFLYERGNHTNKLYAIYGKQFIDSQRPKWREARLRLNALYMEVELDETTPKEIEGENTLGRMATCQGSFGPRSVMCGIVRCAYASSRSAKRWH